jgi:hypothetical protein
MKVKKRDMKSLQLKMWHLLSDGYRLFKLAITHDFGDIIQCKKRSETLGSFEAISIKYSRQPATSGWYRSSIDGGAARLRMAWTSLPSSTVPNLVSAKKCDCSFSSGGSS